MSIERVMVKCLFEMELPLYLNLICSTEMFRINIKTANATMLLVLFNLKTNNSGRYNRVGYLNVT